MTLLTPHFVFSILLPPSVAKPSKLNVLKNDKDSWDYTKDPCSSIAGFTSKLIKALFICLLSHCDDESFCSTIA